MAEKSETTQFEGALAELESLVEAMEGDELALEDALKHFERGMQLTRNCQKALSDAEKKVQILIEKDGGAALEEFGDDVDGDSE